MGDVEGDIGTPQDVLDAFQDMAKGADEDADTYFRCSSQLQARKDRQSQILAKRFRDLAFHCQVVAAIARGTFDPIDCSQGLTL